MRISRQRRDLGQATHKTFFVSRPVTHAVTNRWYDLVKVTFKTAKRVECAWYLVFMLGNFLIGQWGEEETYGNAGLGVLLGRQEEGAVNQWVPIVDLHGILTHNTKCLWHFGRRQIRQNETTNIVISVAALVFHLSSKRKNLELQINNTSD